MWFDWRSISNRCGIFRREIYRVLSFCLIYILAIALQNWNIMTINWPIINSIAVVRQHNKNKTENPTTLNQKVLTVNWNYVAFARFRRSLSVSRWECSSSDWMPAIASNGYFCRAALVCRWMAAIISVRLYGSTHTTHRKWETRTYKHLQHWCVDMAHGI